VPCDDCVTITADAIVENGSAPFSIVYDALTNGSNTQTVTATIQMPNVPPCASVDFDFTVNYTIDPSTPFNGSSWTSEASFEIQDLAGTILTSQGPNLPGSANNATPVSGSVSGSVTTMAGAFVGGVVISVFDSFNDANEDGTFSGTLDYTFTIDDYVLNDIQQITQACDDGDACTSPDVEVIFPCSTGDVVCEPCSSGAPDTCATGPATTQACDDGDPCTANDMEQILDCDGTVCMPCAGTLQNCASGPATTQACDDGDPCTENDMEELLDCVGTVCMPCAGMMVASPDPTFTISTVQQCGGPVDLAPVTAGGVFTGSGASLVSGTIFDALNAAPGVTYNLTYTVSTPGGCMDNLTISFMVVNDCDADGGSFPSGN